MHQPDALQARQILRVQLILGLAITALSLPFGVSAALSALLGAGSCFLANALFAAWVFRGYRAQDPARLVMRFYGAEVAKIALVLGIFAVAFATLDELKVPVLLVAYFAVQVGSAPIAAGLANRTKN